MAYVILSDMKFKFLLIVFAAALPLAACILDTPTPVDPSTTPAPTETLSAGTTLTPTPVQTQTAGATPTPTPVQTQTAESTPASDGTPVKQILDINGIMIPQYSHVPPVTIDVTAEYSATIRTSLGTIVVDLFADQAPVTVNNFIFLADDGYYDGVIFHRVIPSFMIQGGDPTGTGGGGPGYRFQDEIVAGLTFNRPGKLAMANAGPGTNGSQFFVTTVATPHLNGRHTIFGQVTAGQDIADAISFTQTGSQDRPSTPVVIQGIEITKSP